MYTLKVKGINNLLIMACDLVKTDGVEVVARGKKTMEVRPVFMEVEDPTDRTLLYPKRGNNPYQTFFELLWVLGAKDNNIAQLRKFLPRADLYSDNPNTPKSRWRAGYPERIFNYGCTYNDTHMSMGEAYCDGINQFKYVYDTLKADTASRQAVISLWNASLDTYSVSSENDLLVTGDRPCSNVIYFTIRDNELDCSVTMRSNDVIFGLTSINMYEFTVMQSLLAKMLGVEVGKYNHLSNSLHIYEDKYAKFDEIIKQADNYNADNYLILLQKYGKVKFAWEDFVAEDDFSSSDVFEVLYKEMSLLFEQLQGSHVTIEMAYGYGLDSLIIVRDKTKADVNTNHIIDDLIFLLTAYSRIKREDFILVNLYEIFTKIRNTDLKVSCFYHCLKNMKNRCFEDTAEDLEKHIQYCFNEVK